MAQTKVITALRKVPGTDTPALIRNAPFGVYVNDGLYTTLATGAGLDGNNPFTTNDNAQVTITAPNGTYDLRAANGDGTFVLYPNQVWADIAALSAAAVVASDNVTLLAAQVEADAAAAHANRLVTDANVVLTNAGAVATEANRAAIEGLLNYTPTRDPVRLATVAALPANTYNNGAGTITITATGTLTVDAVLTALGNDIVVGNETDQIHNGIFRISTAGAVGVQAVLTRRSTEDTGAELVGACVQVLEGSANTNARYRVDQSAITLGTTPITFAMLPGAVAVESAARIAGDATTLAAAGVEDNKRGYPAIALPGWLYLIRDAAKRRLLGIRTDGTLLAKFGIRIGAAANGLSFTQTLDGIWEIAFGSSQGVVPVPGGEFRQSTTMPGWIDLARDSAKRFLYGVRKNGMFYAAKLEAPAFAAAVDAAFGLFYPSVVDGNYQVFKANKATGSIAQVTSAGNNVGLQLSSDGTKVLYVSDRNGVGTGAVSRYYQGSDSVEWPALSEPGIACFGDSLTGIYAPLLAAALPAKAVYNEGIGGQVSKNIAQRTTGVATTVGVAGNQIPASGAVGITVPVSKDFVLYAYNNPAATDLPVSMRAAITGSGGQIVPGLLKYDIDTESASFTRDTAGSVVAVAAAAPLTVLSGVVAAATAEAAPSIALLAALKWIFWSGRNDVSAGANVSQVLADIASAVAAHKPLDGQVLVGGVTASMADVPASQGGTTGLNDAQSVARLTAIANINAGLSSAYGSRYVDVLAALDALGVGYCTTYTISGNNYRVLNLTFASDGIHPTTNPTQAALMGVFLTAVNAKGW